MRFSPILLLAIPGVTSAATLTVGAAGYVTINDALDAAADGDVIEVEAGDYPETLYIDVDVDIIGLGGVAGNSLSGTGAPAIHVDDATVGLTGFTLNPTADRGVLVENGSTFTGTDLDISGFSIFGMEEGPALSSTDSEVTLTDVIFDGNSGDIDGGAVALRDSLGVFTRVTITNTVSGRDGALAIDFADLFLDDSLFEGNDADRNAGAIEVDNDSSATITATDFIDNTSSEDGGAISAEGGGLLVVDACTFDANIASDGNATGSGGAIHVWQGTDLDLSNSAFDANSAELDGGALDLEDGTYSLRDNTFSENTATDLGGAIHIEVEGDLSIDGDIFDSNSAEWAGALYIRNETVADVAFASFIGNTAIERGGAIRAMQEGIGALTVSFSSFDLNTSGTTGGAISVATGFGGNGQFAAVNNSFSGNAAVTSGGALYLDEVDDIYAEANIFCANDGGFEGGAAGVVDAGDGINEWVGNLVAENVSSSFGGGLRFDNAGPPYLANNTFVGNGSNDGGHVRAFQTSPDLVNNIFMDATDGDGVTQSNSNGARDYNLWFNNTTDDVGDQLNAGDLGNNAVFSDPDLMAYSADGDCSNDDFSLDVGSPAIDAGDPSIYDRDGSTSDIGAFGGPSGLPQDSDGDGFNELQDCDDSDAAVNPAAAEVCDGIDNDCDGRTDGADAAGAVAWYPDADADGYGDDAGEVFACYDPGGMANAGGDCDDADPGVNPGEVEICDGLDQNCDGDVDEGVRIAWYEDLDGDGFGGGDIQIWDCEGTSGLVDVGGDCDDDESAINPGAAEVCDDIDNNCDGDVDEDLDRIWYEDADDDGFGVWETAVEDCGTVDGHSLEAGDCDDTDDTIYPGADEVLGDDIDQDCDGEADGAGEGNNGGKKDKDDGGCGCDNSSGSQSWIALLGGLLFLRRRR